MSSRQLDEEAIFHVARLIAEREGRSTYLDQVCAGDQALRERVKALLDVHEKQQSFLKPNGDIEPTVDQAPITEGPGQQVGRYKLLQQIGEGGFGVVYMAEQDRPVRRKVALKIIKPGMDTNAVVARFEAERQALALMDHPNISRVLDGGTTESGRPYFVMELVRGVPITEYCDKNRLSTHDRLQLFLTVCQAVQHAHQKGIIHRDLKPSNILVTLHDGHPAIKVIDFGIAKATNQQLTEKTLFTAFGQMVGTPQYMSPEQAEMSGLDVDTRSDIYSLGVLLYELLTGKTPLESERLRTAGYAEMQKLIREEEPLKPSTRLSTTEDNLTIVAKHRSTTPDRLHRLIRGDLDWIVMKALEKERARRFVTVSSFADDIHRHLNNEVVEARAPSSAYRIRKFVKRNRGRVMVVSLLGLFLLVGTIGTTSGWIAARSRNQELLALTERYGEKLFQEALTAAMSASDATRELIDEAESAGVDSWKLKMLSGQLALYSGHPEEAVDSLREARNLAKRDGHESVALEAAITTAYLEAGLLADWIAQADRVDRMEPSNDYDRLLKAQTYLAVPEIGLGLVEEACPDTGPQSGLSLAVRATLRAAHATRFGEPDSAFAALEDAHAAVLIMGESPFAAQVELACCASAISLAQEHDLDRSHIKVRAEWLSQRLQEWPEYATGALSRSTYQLAVQNSEEARRALHDASKVSNNPMYLTCDALVVYQSGPEKDVDMASQVISKLTSPWDRALVAVNLMDTDDGRQLARIILDETIQKAQESPILHISAAHLLLSLGEPENAAKQASLGLRFASDDTKESRTWQQWTTDVGRYIAGQITETELLKRTGGNRCWQCDAYLTIGRKRFAQRDFSGARESLNQAVEHLLPGHYSYLLAEGLRKRVGNPESLENLFGDQTSE